MCGGYSSKTDRVAEIQEVGYWFVVGSGKWLSDLVSEGSSVKLKSLYYASIAETISWIGLIVGMIMKYGFDNGSGTELFGPIHGTLFLAYAGLALLCHAEYKWPLKRTAIVLLAAIPPFVGYLVVHGLIKETQDQRVSTSLVS